MQYRLGRSGRGGWFAFSAGAAGLLLNGVVAAAEPELETGPAESQSPSLTRAEGQETSKSTTSAIEGDPFARLGTPIPIAQLGPLKSVRPRRPRSAEAARRPVTIVINSIPDRATVRYGAKELGETPLRLEGTSEDPPLDIVITHADTMTIRTRIMFDVSRRAYTFGLTPAKLH